MNASANRDYLEQRIKTASSAQLHLILIEGAIRFGDRAAAAYEANDVEAGAQPLLRAMDIASELLAAVKHSHDELNQKLASLYQFCFTRLTMAYVNTDRAKLDEALRVLRYERDTWRQACDKLATGEAEEADAKPESLKGPHKPAILPANDMAGDLTGGGLSIEA